MKVGKRIFFEPHLVVRAMSDNRLIGHFRQGEELPFSLGGAHQQNGPGFNVTVWLRDTPELRAGYLRTLGASEKTLASLGLPTRKIANQQRDDAE